MQQISCDHFVGPLPPDDVPAEPRLGRLLFNDGVLPATTRSVQGDADAHLIQLLDGQLGRLGDDDLSRRAGVLATLATELYFDVAAFRGWAYANQALDAARRLGCVPDGQGTRGAGHPLDAVRPTRSPAVVRRKPRYDGLFFTKVGAVTVGWLGRMLGGPHDIETGVGVKFRLHGQCTGVL